MVWNFSHSWRKLELSDGERHLVITLLKLKPSKCMLGVEGGKFLEIELPFKGDPYWSTNSYHIARTDAYSSSNFLEKGFSLNGWMSLKMASNN